MTLPSRLISHWSFEPQSLVTSTRMTFRPSRRISPWAYPSNFCSISVCLANALGLCCDTRWRFGLVCGPNASKPVDYKEIGRELHYQLGKFLGCFLQIQ